MGDPADNVIRMRGRRGPLAAGIHTALCSGRDEIVTNGPNPEFQFIGSDPYNTNVGTGLVVPTTPSADVGDARYLFLLARQRFSTGEQSYSRKGVRLVGIRQYADLVARIPAGTNPPFQPDIGPATGSTVTFHREIKSPLWHPPDGNISWHVVVINNGQRDTRNPQNADGLIYQDPLSPALLYQTITGTAFAPTAYTAPNGGRPWGKPIGASLGNIHDLRYPWRSNLAEYPLDIPIPTPCDVLLFASVRQNDPAVNPTLTDCTSLGALSEEDQFLVVYNNYAQYGTIAGSLVFDQNIGEDVP